MRVRVWEVSGPQLHRWTWAKHSVCLETQCFSMEYSLLPSAAIVLGVGKEEQRCHCALGKPWRGETDHLNVMVGWWLVIFYHANMCSAPICTHKCSQICISADLSEDKKLKYVPGCKKNICKASKIAHLV